MKAKIITPVVTIFNDDNTLDYEGNREVINYLINNGVDGIVPLGSSGEFINLSFSEKKEFIKFYADEVNGRVEIIPGTSSLNFDETVELSNYAISLGVKGVLILPPFYYGISQDEAFHYYDKLAEKINGNIYIYNFKDRTGFDMSAETTLRLAKKHKNIKGMKDSTNNLAHTKSIIYGVTKEVPDFEVYSGFDDHFLPNVMAGGAGCIAAISNIKPKLWSEWVDSYNNKSFSKMIEINRKIDSLMYLYSVQSNFMLIFKKIMKSEGLNITENTNFPFENIDNDIVNTIINEVKEI